MDSVSDPDPYSIAYQIHIPNKDPLVDLKNLFQMLKYSNTQLEHVQALFNLAPIGNKLR